MADSQHLFEASGSVYHSYCHPAAPAPQSEGMSNGCIACSCIIKFFHLYIQIFAKKCLSIKGKVSWTTLKRPCGLALGDLFQRQPGLTYSWKFIAMCLEEHHFKLLSLLNRKLRIAPILLTQACHRLNSAGVFKWPSCTPHEGWYYQRTSGLTDSEKNE